MKRKNIKVRVFPPYRDGWGMLSNRWVVALMRVMDAKDRADYFIK